MQQVINIIEWVLFIYLAIQVGYLLFFSLAGKIAAVKKIPATTYFNRIRVFIPGYKEDNVIIDTALQAVNHNYPVDKFEVVVIADSFSDSTLKALKQLPVSILQVKFDKSTKGKALQQAVEKTGSDAADIAVVLDADNIMAPGFLHAVNNAFEAGYEVMQGHRTAKDPATPFALLDACTEEINNHIFRRGHVAAGLPSALIGSGMAFNWYLFELLLKNVGETAGEDKQMEFAIIRDRYDIAFLDGVYVYDEKVARKEVFSKQRSRWIAVQIEFLTKYFIEGWRQLLKGNIAFFDKVFQTYLLPRVMLVGLVTLWTLAGLLFMKNWWIADMVLLCSLALSLLMGIPAKWYNKKLLLAFVQIPMAMVSFIKAILNIGLAKTQFIHTPHGDAAMQK